MQGDDQRVYELYLKGGKLVFGVRLSGTLDEAVSPNALASRSSLEAKLARDCTMTLSVNGAVVARGKVPGVFTVQPKDELSIGEDALSPVGDCQAPNAFEGKVENVKVTND